MIFIIKNTFQIVAKYFNLSQIDFLFGSVLKIFHSFYPKNCGTLSIFIQSFVSFFIKKGSKKIGKYNLNFKYSADRDLFYRMIKSTT